MSTGCVVLSETATGFSWFCIEDIGGETTM